MLRYNAKIREDVTRRYRLKDEAEWVSLFKRARELASTEPPGILSNRSIL